MFALSNLIFAQSLDTLDIDMKYNICENQSIILSAFSGSELVSPLSFNWRHISGKNNSDTTRVTPLETTTFRVTITDASNLSVIQKHKVVVEKVTIDSLKKKRSCPNIPQGQIKIFASGKRLRYSVDNGKSFHKDSIFKNLVPSIYDVLVKDKFGCSVSTKTKIRVVNASKIDQCENQLRTYNTKEYHFAKLKEDSLYIPDQKEIARNARKWRKSQEYKDLEFKMVFHFLTDDGNNKASRMVNSQLEALNRDFGKPNLNNRVDTTYHHRAVNMRMSFSLAPNGIIRKHNPNLKINNWNKIKKTDKGGSDPLKPEEYINVWICDLPSDISSFAQMPGGRKRIDGIVIDRKYFGIHNENPSSYNEGKTLTHLMGSFFGLKSLSGWSECGDDGALDTPIHNLPFSHCANTTLVSSCDNRRAMQENFMSHAADGCQYMFTRDQRKIIQATLFSDKKRRSLIQNQ